jgi:hypothetical protein
VATGCLLVSLMKLTLSDCALATYTVYGPSWRQSTACGGPVGEGPLPVLVIGPRPPPPLPQATRTAASVATTTRGLRIFIVPP